MRLELLLKNSDAAAREDQGDRDKGEYDMSHEGVAGREGGELSHTTEELVVSDVLLRRRENCCSRSDSLVSGNVDCLLKGYSEQLAFLVS